MQVAWVVALLLAGQADEAKSSTTAARGGLTKLPALTRYVEAPYPEAARAEHRGGEVVLAIDVDAAGLVQRVEVMQASAPEFAEPAMEAACGFEFTPAEAGALGKVPVRITYRYGFVMKVKPLAGTSTGTRAPGAGGDVAPPPEVAAGPPNFYGTIKESGTRRSIGFATVTVSIATTATTTRTSTEADASGRFAFRGLPAGKHLITVRAPMFERLDTKEMVREDEGLEVLYYLTRAERNPYEVVVKERLERREVARRTLRFEEIERIPGTQGDAIRVIQNLPGVARSPFGIGLLIVRGAPPQDTGVFLDGHRLPLLFHFGGLAGLSSVVNSRMLEAIDFFPGGFGPEQGRVSAGAVELRSKFAQTDRVHGEAIVDLSGASVFLEGPVTKDENDGAFVLALRRSYIDGVLAGITSALDSSIAIAPRYWDYQARYDRPLGSRKQMLTVLAYGSDDEIVVVGAASTGGAAPDTTQSRTYFHRLNPKYSYLPDKDTRLVISPIIGIDYSNTGTSQDTSGNSSRFLLRDWNAGARVDGLMRVASFARLRGGADLLYYKFVSDSELPALPRVKPFPGPVPTNVAPRKDTANVPALLTSLYSELEIELDRLILWPGLRLDAYRFSADSQPLIDPRLVEGRTIIGIDPRFTARYRASDSVFLKGQAGIYRQPPLPLELYLNADLPLQVVNQYSAGTEWEIVPRLSLDLQGYYRVGHSVPRASSAVEIVNGRVRLVGFAADVQLRSYGMELLLKLEKTKGLFGWIAYTLSRSENKLPDTEFRPNFVFDQTHNLNVIASYDLGLNWFLSVRFRYVTGGGLPRTLTRWYDADRDGYSRKFADDQMRTPAFHQLDVRIDKRWVYDEWYLEAYLDLQNAYNRTNTEFFAPTFDFKSTVAVPSLPIFPILGIKGVF